MVQGSFRCPCFLLLFACCGFASAADWKVVADAGYLVYEIDTETIKREKDIVNYWVQETVRNREVYFSKYSRDEVPFATMKVNQQIDCKNRFLTFLSAHKYDELGRVIESVPVIQEADSIPPDSLGDRFYKFLCQSANKKRKVR